MALRIRQGVVKHPADRSEECWRLASPETENTRSRKRQQQKMRNACSAAEVAILLSGEAGVGESERREKVCFEISVK